MRTRQMMWLAMTLLAALFVTAIVYAQSGSDFDLSWNTIDNGGIVNSSGGDFGLSGTIGQPDAEVLSGGDFELSGGFWYAAAPDYRVLLPLVLKY